MTTLHPDLVHPDPSTRAAALETLRTDPDASKATHAAAQLLADPDPGVREVAAQILLDAHSEEAARLTVPHIASENITVRNRAGEILAQLGEAAVDALVPYVDDEDYDVRKFAIDVLALLPAHRVAHRIAARLDDPDANVRIAAVDALCALQAAEYADALKALYDREPVARASVVAAFGAFGPTQDPSFLEAALSDEDPVVQFSAAEALASWGAPEAFPVLLNKVEAIDPMARPLVLKALVELWEKHPELGDDLPASLKAYFIEMLDDRDLEYAGAAARGLHAFLDDESVDALLRHTGRDDALDLEIFKALIQYPASFMCIVRAVESGNVAVVPAAQLVLGLLAQGAMPSDFMSHVGRFLQHQFHALDLETKLAALSICQRLQDPGLHPVLYASLADDDPEVAAFGTEIAQEAGIPAPPSFDAATPGTTF